MYSVLSAHKVVSWVENRVFDGCFLTAEFERALHGEIRGTSWLEQSEHRWSTFGRRSEWINTSQNKGELCFSRGPRTRQAHCSTTVTAVYHRHLTCTSQNKDKDRCEHGWINCGNLRHEQQTGR